MTRVWGSKAILLAIFITTLQACGGPSEPPFRTSCSAGAGEPPGDIGEVRVGEVTFFLGNQPRDNLSVQFSAGRNLFSAKIPVVVATGPGSVVELSGADTLTSAPLYFEYGTELVRARTEFTVPQPTGDNTPGFVPGAMWVESLGVYEVEVRVNGELQGKTRFAFCTSPFLSS